MKSKNIILILISILFADYSYTQSLPIALDGRFDDWATAGSSFTDTQGDGGAFDLISFSVSNDSAYLYIKFSLADEFQLNSSNDLFLELDTDNDAATGYLVNGIGAELGWKLGGRYGYFNYGGSSLYIEHNDIEFYALPTVTSTQFEMAISRNAYPDNVNPLFNGDTIKICFVDQGTNGDMMPNTGQYFEYIFDESPVQVYQPIDLQKNDSLHIRLLSYNTLYSGLVDLQRQPAFERIISTINPDIITFNECWNVQWYEARDLLDTWLPLQGGASWNCWKIDGSNITCSRFPIQQNWKILPDRRITASLIDLPVEYVHDMVVINAHFKCCDGDTTRQREADAFINFVRDIKLPGGLIDVPWGTPFVLSGDLNLVGESQQLSTLLTGDIQDTVQFGSPISPDWDGTDLNDIISFLTDQRMAYTWLDNSSSYWPGRLDFAIASEQDLVLEKAYTVNTLVMSTSRLTQYGLQQTDTETASDHLPKITDFSIPLILENQGLNNKDEQIEVFPNPANDIVYVRITNSQQNDFNVILHDVFGNTILIPDSKKNFHSKNIYSLSVSDLKPGMYLLSINTKGNKLIEKLTITK